MLVDIAFDAEKIRQYYAQFAYDSVEVTDNGTEMLCKLKCTIDGEQIESTEGFQKIAPGLYWASHFCERLLDVVYGREGHTWMDWQWCDAVGMDRWAYIRNCFALGQAHHWYGIADSPEQVQKYAPNVEFFYNNPEIKCFILCTPFVKANGADFRWHKNGTYIGTQEPQCENFANEPAIEEVVMFKVVVLL